MKKFIVVLLAFLFVAALTSCVNSGIATISTPGLEFTLINDGTAYSVSRGTAIAAHIVIPLKHYGLPVLEIGSGGFLNYTTLVSVIIPDSVTSIGFMAFAGCTNLTGITIPNSVTSIGFVAFVGCTNLASITIPSSVVSIDDAAFADCRSLVSITIPNSVTSMGSDVFYGCTRLINIFVQGHTSRPSGWNEQWNSYSAAVHWADCACVKCE